MPFTKVLIANRGAIACRIIRTLRRMGIASVAVYSEADTGSLHVEQADEAICIGPAPAAQSYLDADKILSVARETGAQAIHPGYGFLSENPAFAESCAAAGIAFIGPSAENMRAFGLKHTARALAEAAGVPLLPATGLLGTVEEAPAEAERTGYPLMPKSTAGNPIRIMPTTATRPMMIPGSSANASISASISASFLFPRAVCPFAIPRRDWPRA